MNHHTCRNALILSLLLATAAAAERSSITIGGQSGTAWSATALKWVALDDTSAAPALQPKELWPRENVVAGEGALENIFGFQWHRGKTGMEATGKEMGLHPRIWNASNSRTVNEVFDGDPRTFKPLTQLVSPEEYAEYSTATSSGSETGVFNLRHEVYTLDLGIEMPLEQIRFYPPQFGVDKRGVPYKDTAPQGFEVSVARYPQDYLLLGTEAFPWHSLDRIVRRTLANSSSIIDADFDRQFVRFIRIDLSLMRQLYSLAEIEAYGSGVPSRAYLVSKAVDFGAPANYGRIHFAASTLQRGDDGELRTAPPAAARMVLETRSGSDDTPLSYFIVDELGADVEVTKRQYELAKPPRIDRTGLRLPGMRGAITEDARMWTPWSSPYDRSGLQNRSADGRQYLQFRLSLETEDPAAFVRVDSLSFEYSPLLVRQVLGEVSLDGEPSQSIVQVRAGETHPFAYDISASFDSPVQGGFDGVRLDLPPGSELLGFEMGIPLVPVIPDSVHLESTGIAVFFGSHRVTRTDNRPLRLRLSAPLLNSSLLFTGDVLDTQSDLLPQSIDAGDASSETTTNSLQIYASQVSLPALSDVDIAPSIMTPNADRINDQATVHFKILGLERGRVRVEACELSGRRVALIADLELGQGLHSQEWDGTDSHGSLVPPGVYLCRVSVDTESGTTQITRTIAVAY
jgi:hypothetical protein